MLAISHIYRPLRQIFSKRQSRVNPLHDLSFDIYQGENRWDYRAKWCREEHVDAFD